MLVFTSLVLPALFCGLARAAVVPSLEQRSGAADIAARKTHAAVTTLSHSQVEAFTPFVQFARAAYCPTRKVQGWQCGEACSAIPGFQVTLTGGDGNDVQLFYVGYWPQQNAVVVGHEGTDPTQLLSLLTDAEILQTTFDPTLFPGVSHSITAHSGFVDQHALTAPVILKETQRLIAKYGASTVLLVGHSLGGALAELDSLFLTLNLPSTIHIQARTFGTPRVGNSAYAAFFDSKVPDFERINNESDLIPIVPGRALGFSHPHGEIHIVDSDEDYAVSCPGDDDATDSQCTISTVPDIIFGNILDHLGPYNGIYIGTIFCT